MITLNEELSTAERRMFQDLGWDYLFYTNIPVMAFYNMAIEKAFIENKNNMAVHALRRAAKHMSAGAYRSNKVFEDLIGY